MIESVKRNTKAEKLIYIGTAVRSFGNCKHYYDAQPGAMGWTNDN